jgi:hypothetical protein
MEKILVHPRPKSSRNLKFLAMPDSEFAEFGIDLMVYIKPVRADGDQGFAVFSANGQEMALASDQNSAMAFAIQEDFTPLRVQ